MKFLFDFFPIALFFITFKFYDDPQEGVLAATAVAIIATILQVFFFWLKNKRIEKMHIITLILITVLGGATLILKDPVFIKWKPTAVNWMFAIAFLGSQYIGEKSFVKRMMSHAVELPDTVWAKLNFAWVVFFTAMGFANLYVAFNYDLSTWVDFKTYGMLGLTILFVLLQAVFIAKHMPEEKTIIENKEELVKLKEEAE
ncbi:MAG: septation protein A [Gammaproteobacteria bacterium]|nr:septation protein A [Gammaproteobacteria bacterium]MDH5660321.1 septation protein A [Gammaproteobacteria bacterium]